MRSSSYAEENYHEYFMVCQQFVKFLSPKISTLNRPQIPTLCSRQLQCKLWPRRLIEEIRYSPSYGRIDFCYESQMSNASGFTSNVKVLFTEIATAKGSCSLTSRETKMVDVTFLSLARQNLPITIDQTLL